MKKFSLVILLVLFSAPAMAYVGPGLGMGVIGTIFGVLAAIVLALFGLFWYPLKRALSKKKAAADASQTAATITEIEPAAPLDSVPTQPETESETHSDNHTINHPSALNETSDTTTAKRTENQVQ